MRNKNKCPIMQLNLRWKCVGAILILGVYCCSANTLASGSSVPNQSTRRVAKELDVKAPLLKILDKWSVLTKELNVTVLIDTVVTVLTQCLPQGGNGSFNLPLPIPIKFSHLVEMNKLNRGYLEETLLPNQLEEYCKSDDFKTIHNFLWHDDLQFRELLDFMYRFGFGEQIYQFFKQLYAALPIGCDQDIIDDIPSGPTTLKRSKSDGTSRSNIRDQAILSHSSNENPLMMPFQTECNIIQIITNLLNSGALELLQFVETLLEQINTDASLHFLLGKIQEPIKGKSFREFRLLEPVRKLFIFLNDALRQSPLVVVLLNVVEALTGLNFDGVNLVELIVSVIEMLLWQNMDMVPPYP